MGFKSENSSAAAVKPKLFKQWIQEVKPTCNTMHVFCLKQSPLGNEAQAWHPKGKEEDNVDETWGCVNWNLKFVPNWTWAIGLKMNWQPHSGKQRRFATPHVYNFTTAIATPPELPQMTNHCIQSFLSLLTQLKISSMETYDHWSGTKTSKRASHQTDLDQSRLQAAETLR